MTKLELIKEICKRTGVDNASVTNTIEAMMSVMKDTMSKGECIYLRGFGSFILKHRAQKTARNISKNQTIIVPAHDLPAFKPCKDFADMLKK
ncbi:MAG: integration host factor subunit beta [Bacteroidaceae bacterium]|jgi:DNA-binding protein HU-beta|nr:integration host factor subunit beta [Bacteroidaceae bacterium]MBR4709165.1 integration host factor subunit beta [Bacteroidaceae bacterium]MBR6820584.1 integration host factor subunit beta [Bacteroidaceae bacterium]MBR7051521.1 integration host factor subunit beta [Bacteroidaceae bacterium]